MNPNHYISRKLAISYCVVAYLELKDKCEVTYEVLAEKIFSLMESNKKSRDIIIKVEKLVDFNNLNTEFFVTNKQAMAYGIIGFHTLQISGSKDNFSYELLAKVICDVMKIDNPYIAIKRVKKLLGASDIR